MKDGRKTVSLLFVVALLSLCLVGCGDVHVSIDMEGTPLAGANPLPATTEALSDSPESIATNTPVAGDAPEPAATPTPTVEPATPTVEPATPTAEPAAPAIEPTASAPAPTPTREPLRPTAPSCASYQGQTYTIVFNEQQINTLIDAALQAAGRAYVSTGSVSLQNGQITAQAQFKGLAGQTVDAVLVVAVTARNYDVYVTVVQAQVGQAGMTDAQKAAISTTLEHALETEMAQAHDYTCVDSIAIANGTMTIVYH